MVQEGITCVNLRILSLLDLVKILFMFTLFTLPLNLVGVVMFPNTRKQHSTGILGGLNVGIQDMGTLQI